MIYTVDIRSLSGHDFVLLQDFTYKTVTVKKGFISNGANIPRLFWSVIPPNYMSILPAVTMHDYLCSVKRYTLADIYFKELLLLSSNLPKWQAYCMYTATTLYSKHVRPRLIRWGKHSDHL